MSNLLSERNVESSKPSISQLPAPQAFRSKSSKIKRSKISSPCKKSTVNTTITTLQAHSAKVLNDVVTLCENMDINHESEVNSIESSTVVSKTKNAKKKERRKQLQKDFPKDSVQSAQMSQADNFTRHDPTQPLASVSGSSLSQIQKIAAATLPNSSLTQSEPSVPRYIQNALQHPLLNYTFSVATNAGVFQNSETSPKKKQNTKKDENKFESYLSENEVELRLKENKLHVGSLRINPKQYQQAYISRNDRSEQDILIEGIKDRNRALEGDIVVVECLYTDDDLSDKQLKGKVVQIKEKVHSRTCIGNLKLMPDRNKQRALFVPRDHRVPRLNILSTFWPDNFYEDAKKYEDTLFLARILVWTDTRFAVGKIESIIGQSGDMTTETMAILAEMDLDITPFGPEFQHLYPSVDYTIPDEEIKLREDCRRLCLFSIDPFNCRDIDDAVSCRKLDNGNYEIGVHISDVAHYLTEGTLLDKKVAEKATTIYMVEKAYHMLPDELCMLCSLFPGVNKLTFSVFWEITSDAQVLSHRFAKTVINSCCQLAYEHAQAILEDQENADAKLPEIYNGFQYADIRDSIKVLGRLSAIFRKNRFENGALRIDQPKISFRLSPLNGLPESFWVYESKESHQLIEEFMLLANMTVANRIYNDHPKLAFLRCHPPPSGYMLRQLAESLKHININLDVSTAGDLHRSLTSIANGEKAVVTALSMLCSKPMTRAKYFCAGANLEDDFHHYALNVPLYTHFTSPIRRYADIMVHRLLAASLNYREIPNWEIDKVHMVAGQCNKQKYNAKKAGELSTELYTLKYIELYSPVTAEAVVVDIKERCIDVIVLCMGLNRRIYFNEGFHGKYKCYTNNDSKKLSKMVLDWHSTEEFTQSRQVIDIFDIVKVEMHKTNDILKIATKLVRPL